jgi:xanthine dehydrogenase/oxidase
LAQACYLERVDLSAHGFYATPDIGFDWTTCKGSPFNYFTYGAAFAEVEIDTLTGDFHTRTADIVMDLGSSINPAIDIVKDVIFPHRISGSGPDLRIGPIRDAP